MSPLQSVPLWLAIPVAFFVVLGSTLTLIGAFGFARLPSFYDRLHAPTLATSWGTGAVMIASALMFSFIEKRPIVHEFAIGFCIVLTTPITLMMLGRAALERDRAEGSDALPPDMRTRPARPDDPPAQE
ncbi:monovalent cation/H(+) antiporter subunit G [Paracoccus sp. S3-43]|uniref:monovalent cation/H(+) antiporter subunit G n=1 Tax=Paracoccus sp. S3-43 TaxID=3030011 RepID=UPI0023B044FF|nr:monovalent cation/H(+) antiporter subunit G [Paracoccus sp. S3-43]WEF25237.1 monovalent cation/H(+) antiporter subunit G [Paracoccus sp. S3-43]